MKKMISLISLSVFLSTFASCSEEDNHSSSNRIIETTVVSSEAKAETTIKEIPTTTQTITQTANQTTTHATTEHYEEIIVNTDNLSSPLETDYFSLLLPSEWSLHSKGSNLIEYEIEDNSMMIIEIEKDYSFLASSKKGILSNDDYISYRQNNRKDLEFFQNSNSISFAFSTNDVHSYLEYQFYNSGYVIDITFRAYNHYCLQKESIERIMNGLKLNIPSESNTEENTVASNTSDLFFSGEGDTVTNTFSAPDCIRITGNYSGEGLFIVNLYDDSANLEDQVFSNLGTYSGEKVFQFKKGKKYMFEVTAGSGEWQLSVE
ncbi:MAG: hypothetical protein J6U00_12260 [Ruminococcus sp.]|uniref:hypothetical protein n=1 Tax=Ruminococcus sp. TaxID=41978 RepID=UPI001B2123F4|nr:hypothetical protein [Ruminococcus sp.]MBO7474744.1 hypothetical protein [Ruminococcus sp.]